MCEVQISPTTGTFPQASLKPDVLPDDCEGNKDRSRAVVAATTDTLAKFKFPAGDLITTTQIPSASIAENDNYNSNQVSKCLFIVFVCLCVRNAIPVVGASCCCKL